MSAALRSVSSCKDTYSHPNLMHSKSLVLFDRRCLRVWLRVSLIRKGKDSRWCLLSKQQHNCQDMSFTPKTMSRPCRCVQVAPLRHVVVWSMECAPPNHSTMMPVSCTTAVVLCSLFAWTAGGCGPDEVICPKSCMD